MKLDIREMTIGIETSAVTPMSPNYRLPSWPPSPDWPVSIDKNGVVISRWGDPKWDLAPWAGRILALNFGDGGPRKGAEAECLDAENANIMRLVATWLIWGPQAARSVSTVRTSFHILRPIAVICSRNGISATRLMRFPKVFEQVHKVITPSHYKAAITLLHCLYDAREVLGFTIVDPVGIKRLAAAEPVHDRIQTPYIPPRIWLYQVTRLRECLTDFILHQEQLESCFHFCLNAYIKRFGSIEAALVQKKSGDRRGPFNSDLCHEMDYQGTFSEVAARFGIAEMLAKWVLPHRSGLDMRSLSSYFSTVTLAGLAYICNFTLQRKEEVASLRSGCLMWEEDEQFGRVPIICGATTKTASDSDARWLASPSVEIAIQALSIIARLRMICDRSNQVTLPSAADQSAPYLFSTASEPWGSGKARPYNVRSVTRSFGEMVETSGALLLAPDQMKITAKDLEIALRLTPNLPDNEFSVGKVWPLAWHQYRRTGAVNMFASGDISDSTMQQQLKHSSRLMPLYYGRNHSRLHFNKEVQATIVMAMYQAQAMIAQAAITGDRFVSPHSLEHKETHTINVLSTKDFNALITMATKGAIAFREHRLGGCMKAGVCEYGGIESVARCAGGADRKPCADVLYDRTKEPQVRADLLRVTEEIKILPAGQPRYNALVEECLAMENYLNAVSDH